MVVRSFLAHAGLLADRGLGRSWLNQVEGKGRDLGCNCIAHADSDGSGCGSERGPGFESTGIAADSERFLPGCTLPYSFEFISQFSWLVKPGFALGQLLSGAAPAVSLFPSSYGAGGVAPVPIPVAFVLRALRESVTTLQMS